MSHTYDRIESLATKGGLKTKWRKKVMDKNEKKAAKEIKFYNNNEHLLEAADDFFDELAQTQAEKVFDIIEKSGKYTKLNKSEDLWELRAALRVWPVREDSADLTVADFLESGYYKRNDVENCDSFGALFRVNEKIRSYKKSKNFYDLQSEDLDVNQQGIPFLTALLDEWGIEHEDQCEIESAL